MIEENTRRDRAPAAAARPVTNGLRATSVLVYLGLTLQLVQVGIIPLLPLIGRDLHVTPGKTSWLVTASLLSGAIFLAVFSRLADLVGKRSVILLCLALVLAGSILGWVGSGFTELVIARVLMGAAFPMLALPEAVAADTMPRERAQTTIGAIHAGTGVGIAAGLLLGSLAGAGDASWRAFFAVSAVASALAIAGTLAWVRDSAVRALGGLDWQGAALLSAGLIGLLLAFSEAPTWGWLSAPVLILGLGGLAVLVGWWRSQERATHPLIKVAYLVRRDIRIPYAVTFLVAFGIYGALTAISRIAQTPSATGYGYGFTALQVAWYAIPQALGGITGAILLRRLVRRGQRVAALAIGSGAILVAFILFGLFTKSPAATMIGLLFDSAGLAAALAASQIIIVQAVGPEESGIALGLSIVLYAVGNTVGSAVLGVLLTGITLGHTPLPALAAYHWGFLISGVAAALALVLCRPLAAAAPRGARAASPAT
jgi:predicted MFS family arabinose efflux permease